MLLKFGHLLKLLYLCNVFGKTSKDRKHDLRRLALTNSGKTRQNGNGNGFRCIYLIRTQYSVLHSAYMRCKALFSIFSKVIRNLLVGRLESPSALLDVKSRKR